jgi:ABC-type antimicrobial peptide transport system permease subunit
MCATLFGVFAAVAAAIAVAGLYAVVAYEVARRRREIGIRMALGVSPVDVRGMVVCESMQSKRSR